jgi:hypothetical protein
LRIHRVKLIQTKALWLRQGGEFGLDAPWTRLGVTPLHKAYPSLSNRAYQCIAAGPDLWFEELGFPHPADAR